MKPYVLPLSEPPGQPAGQRAVADGHRSERLEMSVGLPQRMAAAKGSPFKVVLSQ